MEREENFSEGTGSDLLIMVVPVADVVEAIPFYRHVFEAESDPEEEELLYLGGGREVAIRLVAGDGEEIAETDDDGKMPRCEFIVDDPTVWSERAVAAGAQILVRQMNPNGEPIYIQFIDPFGHRWGVAAPFDGQA